MTAAAVKLAFDQKIKPDMEARWDALIATLERQGMKTDSLRPKSPSSSGPASTITTARYSASHSGTGSFSETQSSLILPTSPMAPKRLQGRRDTIVELGTLVTSASAQNLSCGSSSSESSTPEASVNLPGQVPDNNSTSSSSTALALSSNAQ